ncbi:MAG: carboxyl transferase domain-containing protein [Pseudomonadales bacterium]
MATPTLLIANRGEIAIRIMRSARRLGWRCVAIYAEDDAACLHTRHADVAVALRGRGASAYLDQSSIVAAAAEEGAQWVHPGYGFLAENAGFAEALAAAGIGFIGPDAALLAALGDKVEAKSLAEQVRVPTIAQYTNIGDREGLTAFLAKHGAIMLKASAGGGGRGMRIVRDASELDDALSRARSEAASAFGSDSVYAEKLIEAPRHIEVQIFGDGQTCVALGDRECSLQRRHQKLVEFAPAMGIDTDLRTRITNAAVAFANSINYRSLGTFEFLVSGEDYYFIEANPRIQVEHTVTEAVTGLDLVALQLKLTGNATIADLNLPSKETLTAPDSCAVQLRVNMESINAAGDFMPSGGTLAAFDPPMGPGVRVDSYGYSGYTTSPAYDSLLAKVIVSARDYDSLLLAARDALSEFRIQGVPTNIAVLSTLLELPEVRAGEPTTATIGNHQDALTAAANTDSGATRYFSESANAAGAAPGTAGVQVDTSDPLAVLAYGKTESTAAATPGTATHDAPEGCQWCSAPMQGTVLALSVQVGDAVAQGAELLVMDAMKMEHVIEAPCSGIIREIEIAPGQALFAEHPLILIEQSDAPSSEDDANEIIDLDAIREDLQEAIDRHAVGLDANRPEAVAKRRKTGHQTARENLEQLIDPDSMVEYGPLVIAAQRRRRKLADLIEKTPADGLVAGVASINGALFPDGDTQCAVLSYDYTVLAGTQGGQNHRKKDRLFEVAEKNQLPVVFFTEGGGGRPGDTDGIGGAGLDCWAFNYFGRLSGLVPLIGITSGRCFAGNAALLGCCDVVIATEGSNIGMGGPAMIEGGGLGVFRPEDIGPMEVQIANGVIDLPVKDYAEAVTTAQKYLSYFQGPTSTFEAADQRALRNAIPENRLRVYDVRNVIETLADTDSVLELRAAFGPGMITAFARIEGRPIGIIANNPTHLSGAIDSDGADKATRFMQLCDAFDIPLLFLCDTPGIMVGPEIERTALVRHAARMFVTSASLTVPFCTIVLRKGYGLGAQAMAGGSFKAPIFTVAWPTGEFGGMGLEGAVKLGYRNELAAIEDPEERAKAYEERVARMYAHGRAVSTASYFEIDDVIDPKDSRHWVLSALKSAPAPAPRTGKKRPCVDTW